MNFKTLERILSLEFRQAESTLTIFIKCPTSGRVQSHRLSNRAYGPIGYLVFDTMKFKLHEKIGLDLCSSSNSSHDPIVAHGAEEIAIELTGENTQVLAFEQAVE